jgi:hypothetical protein
MVENSLWITDVETVADLNRHETILPFLACILSMFTLPTPSSNNYKVSEVEEAFPKLVCSPVVEATSMFP